MELNKRIAKYNANVNMLYPILKDKNPPRKCKIIMYKTILKPILTYAAEYWTLTTKTMSKVQAAEMRVPRLIRGLARRDRMRNDRIREELGVNTSLLEEVERSKLRWYGHVKRMEQDRKPRKYLEWKLQGRRPVGRPRKRWMEGVRDRLEKRGLELEQVEEEQIHEDRIRWPQIMRRDI